MKLISKTVVKFILEKFEHPVRAKKKEEIKFLFQNQMTFTYKTEERKLKEVFIENISPASDNDKINLLVNYRTSKLNNFIIKNKFWQNTKRKHYVISPPVMIIRRVLHMNGSKSTQKQDQ